jgi:VanZ family protein
MKKVIELLRKVSAAIGITGNGVHTFYSLILSVCFFYFGVWFEESHSVLAGFFAGLVCPIIIGCLVEFAQERFHFGQASWEDVLADVYGSVTGASLLLILNIIF